MCNPDKLVTMVSWELRGYEVGGEGGREINDYYSGHEHDILSIFNLTKAAAGGGGWVPKNEIHLQGAKKVLSKWIRAHVGAVNQQAWLNYVGGGDPLITKCYNYSTLALLMLFHNQFCEIRPKKKNSKIQILNIFFLTF